MAPSRPAAQSPRRRAPRRLSCTSSNACRSRRAGLNAASSSSRSPARRSCRLSRWRPLSPDSTPAPVDYAAAALAAGDEEGRERLRAGLETWPAGLRRRVHALFRALAAEKASARAGGTEPKGFARRPVSRTPARVSSISAPTCLSNSNSESHEPRSEPGAKTLSLSNSGCRTVAHFGTPDH